MHSRYNSSVQISRSFSLRSILYYTLIALHRCDSSQHILPRPRKCTWDITFSSAVSPFMSGQLPKLSPVITDESRTSIKQILYSHSIFLSPMLKKVNPFSYTFIVTFLSFFIITVYYTFSTRHGTDLISTNPVIGSA